ncbi:conserved within P. aerophilum [Pyrobaculum aerophilum str. IM2]|uniref:Conserved within P. aerophilum n=2 Tax=Pyrobaculum aerophilum TaxID=13773 RepID=Q8ZSY9_PYRAE|nr:conserved within P. aerophilum [Pyrobaculum aerophilum str. IM2]
MNRLFLLVIILFFILIFISFFINYLYMFFMDEKICYVNFNVACMSVENISGVVYGPCEYSGVIKVPPPISASDFKCVTAGRVGNMTAVVFIGRVFTGQPDPEAPFETGLKRLCGVKKGLRTFTDEAYGYRAVLVAYPERGIGYLSFIYDFSLPPYVVRKPVAELNHSAFLFASDGIYIKSEHRDARGISVVPLEVGVKTEVLGPTLKNCVFVINTVVDTSKLKIGTPLYNASGRYIKIG